METRTNVPEPWLGSMAPFARNIPLNIPQGVACLLASVSHFLGGHEFTIGDGSMCGYCPWMALFVSTKGGGKGVAGFDCVTRRWPDLQEPIIDPLAVLPANHTCSGRLEVP